MVRLNSTIFLVALKICLATFVSYPNFYLWPVGGSNAPLLRLACQNLKKEKEKKKEGEQEGKQQAARMTSENTGITIEDAPSTFKSSCLFGSSLGTRRKVLTE